jgi:hypothetical protein
MRTVPVDDLRQQLRERGYLSHGIERWFALDPWSSRTFWVELAIVAGKAALLIGLTALLPLVAIMLFRNHPLTGWETLAMTFLYGSAALLTGFVVLVLVALVLKLRPSAVIDTPRVLLGISFLASGLLCAPIALWWYRFDSPPSLSELIAGLILIVGFFLTATVAISAALLSFSIYELQRVPAIHQRPRGGPMTIAVAIVIALLFLPAYAGQEKRAPAAPLQVITTPTSRRLALVGVDGLTFDVLQARSDLRRNFATLAPLPSLGIGSTTERWATIGTGVAPPIHGVHAVEGVRLRGGRHLIQALSNADLVLRNLAVAMRMARREPLPPTIRRRDFVWEIFAGRGMPSTAVNWWTTEDARSGALESIGQASIFAAAGGDPVEIDATATRRLIGAIGRSPAPFVTIYLPALDVILNRLALDRSTQLADSVRALDGLGHTVDALRDRGYDVVLIGLPGDRQSGAAVVASTIPLAARADSPYDVAPTLCALMGFPASSEMRGHTLMPTSLPRIASYGARSQALGSAKVDEEYYRNLNSLGYIR